MQIEMIVGRHSLVAILLIVLISTSFVATVIAQDDDEGDITETSEVETTTEQSETTDVEDVELPIGLELAARFHELAEAHKAEIRAIIEEFKFNNSQNHEERLRIIEAYHNQTRLRLEEMETERRRLSELFDNGTIDRDEFLAGMRLLKACLKGPERIADKLGWQLSEVAKMAAEQHRQKAQTLKELHRQMQEQIKAAHREMKEEMKSHGPPWATTTATASTATTTETTTVETTATTASEKGHGRGK